VCWYSIFTSQLLIELLRKEQMPQRYEFLVDC
jgi:hypothetical protein